MPDTLSPPDLMDSINDAISLLEREGYRVHDPKPTPTEQAESTLNHIAQLLLMFEGHLKDGAVLSETKRKSLGGFVWMLQRLGAIDP